MLSSMIPHTRVYLKKFKLYERGRGLSIGGGSNHDQLKTKSAEFIDTSHKTLP